MIAEIPQVISCSISTKSENLSDRAATCTGRRFPVSPRTPQSPRTSQVNGIRSSAAGRPPGRCPGWGANFHPGFLLGLVLHLATGWVSVGPDFEAAIDVPDQEERARHVENAVRTLLSQPAPA
jgi:hypothetical protein